MKNYLSSIILGFAFVFVLPFTIHAATLDFDPNSTTVAPNSSFTVDIDLEAGTQQVASTDIYILYDENYLEVEQVTAGSYFPLVQPNTETKGRLYIAGTVTTQGDYKTGTGTVATVSFKALQEGSTSMSFDCDESVSDKSSIVQNDTAATHIIECSALQTHAVTITSTGTPSTNAQSSSSSTTSTTSTGTTLPTSGVYEDMLSYAITGGILLAAGVILRVLLKII
jgi:hypothetical protein